MVLVHDFKNRWPSCSVIAKQRDHHRTTRAKIPFSLSHSGRGRWRIQNGEGNRKLVNSKSASVKGRYLGGKELKKEARAWLNKLVQTA